MTTTIRVTAPCVLSCKDDWIFFLSRAWSVSTTAALSQTDGGGRGSGGSQYLPRGLLWFCQLIAAPLGGRESTSTGQRKRWEKRNQLIPQACHGSPWLFLWRRPTWPISSHLLNVLQFSLIFTSAFLFLPRTAHAPCTDGCCLWSWDLWLAARCKSSPPLQLILGNAEIYILSFFTLFITSFHQGWRESDQLCPRGLWELTNPLIGAGLQDIQSYRYYTTLINQPPYKSESPKKPSRLNHFHAALKHNQPRWLDSPPWLFHHHGCPCLHFFFISFKFSMRIWGQSTCTIRRLNSRSSAKDMLFFPVKLGNVELLQPSIFLRISA